MSFINLVIELFRKPFPQGRNRVWYYSSLGILSLFVIVFLYIYTPFGMHQLKTNKLAICSGFGAMTFLGATIYELIIHQIRNFRKSNRPFTFGIWSLNNLGAAFFISITNFIFARLVFFGYFDWNLYPNMLYATLMIGIIPLTFIGGFTLFNQSRKNQNSTTVTKIITELPSNLNKTQSLFDIPLNQIRYIEALQNYVKIAYLNIEGQLKVKTERATLKEIQEKIKGGSVVKCHRSFLVNRDTILTTSGNSQGLYLKLSNCETIIPVSRTWVPLFRKS